VTAFVHLRVHSEYSLVDSVVRVKPLVDKVRELGMSAVALTDLGNVSAMVKFYRAATDKGIKPIIGADVWIGESLADADPSRLTLLCANRSGFRNLSRLLTDGHARGQAHGRALILKEWLDIERLDGLLGLSGGQSGELGRAFAGTRPERALDVLDDWCTLLPGRFYIELQRAGRPAENEYLQRAVQLAAARGVPIVATNEVCFLERTDFDAHETRVCIAQGRTLNDPARPRHYTEQQYLKSPQEMAELFAELPEALTNTVEIAKRCNLELDLGNVFLPRFELPDGRTAQAYLREQADLGLRNRLRHNVIEAPADAPYFERLARELDVICAMGFEGYFLIVADFIAWARQSSIPVGPGRGSGAGSLVAYALGITDLDPLEHDLLFERFLNPERVSLPDFDVDFCIEGRDRVIDYVSRRYGRDRVSQIITYGTMAARAVVRDVGRVLGMTYGHVDRIAKLIPFEIGITLDKALAEDEELRALYESDEEIRGLIDLARQLEGLARNAGTHAGGVVIAPDPLIESMPLYSDPTSASLTQLDKDDLEAIGLVKFDFLGLKTLTIIDKALATINRERIAGGDEPVDIAALDLTDRKAYDLLNRCQTTAVFQLESRGMRDLIKRLKPDRFDDLVAILALFRPGPLQSGMVDEFIERKHGRNIAAIDYLHPSLEPILQPTYGVILYQEQVMQIAQVLAGYSLGGADLLRRAMGKKKPEEMAKQRAVFQQGATERGIPADRAQYIFDLMEKFAGYGFNKSHSAAYALLAYQTAWLKAHYPEAFMAAVMTADMDHTDKLVVFINDCRGLGIEIEPPDVNRSGLGFSVGGPQRINYGLGAIKGVGQSVVEALVADRDRGGAYTDLLDLCRRVGQQKLNRRVLEALVRSGALDGFGLNRATLMNAIGAVLSLTEKAALADAAGQAGLFGPDDDATDIAHVFAPLREWTKRERREAERDSLGLYLTSHPFEDYAEHCRHFSNGSIASVISSLPAEGQPYQTRRTATLAGVVMDVKRRGSRIALDLDDNTDRVEVTLFDEVYAASKHLINKHAVLVVDGQIRYDDFLGAWRLTAHRVRSVDEAIEEHARRITISLSGEDSGIELIGRLRETLEPFRRGNCEVSIQYRSPAGQAQLTCGDAWSVRPTRELRERLSRLLGDDRYAIHYPKHFV
jgi:DNA polymerase-3 subunit alpha